MIEKKKKTAAKLSLALNIKIRRYLLETFQ